MQAKAVLADALNQIISELGYERSERITLERPKQAKFGDLTTNAAMLLAKPAGRPPKELAALFCERLVSLCPEIQKAEVAGPGFCNVTFRSAVWQSVISAVEEDGAEYGRSRSGAGKTALVEYVSANPTGPLHIGHGRGAALGDSVARILRAAGYGVDTEYYLNDAGRQMNILGRSIWLRARQLSGEEIEFPGDHYRGDYIIELAKQILVATPDLLTRPEEDAIGICRKYGMQEILTGIKTDLGLFRCEHNRFESEELLYSKGAVARVLKYLEEAGRSYEKDGALWLKTAEQGDDHDRVLRKNDGSLTYFASDIAYHHEKFERGYEWLIDVWGADHHGYMPRMRVAISEMGHDPEKFSVLLVQLVNLVRDGKMVAMSTRSGEFYPLADLIEEVGVDAARFTFLSRSNDSPLDFDIDLAKKRTLDNPVYYVQYAHARVCSLLRRAEERGVRLPDRMPAGELAVLEAPEELALMRELSAFTETVSEAAARLAPYLISNYLLSLAALVHGYYAHRQILDDNESGSKARLALLRACGRTIRNGLFLLGVSAPEAM